MKKLAVFLACPALLLGFASRNSAQAVEPQIMELARGKQMGGGGLIGGQPVLFFRFTMANVGNTGSILLVEDEFTEETEPPTYLINMRHPNFDAAHEMWTDGVDQLVGFTFFDPIGGTTYVGYYESFFFDFLMPCYGGVDLRGARVNWIELKFLKLEVDQGPFSTYSYQVQIRVFGECFPASETRCAGEPANALAFHEGLTEGPVIGRTWDPVIEHTNFLPGADFDFLLRGEPINQPSPVGTWLCDAGGPVAIVPRGAAFAVPIPDDLSVLGRSHRFQGGAYDSEQGVLKLTNALDVVVGSYRPRRLR